MGSGSPRQGFRAASTPTRRPVGRARPSGPGPAARPIEPGSRGCVILDRDGVINHDLPDYIRTPEQWRPIDGSLEAIAMLDAAGFAPVVVSNQSGVGRGLLSAAVLERIHARMSAAVAAAGGRLAGIYHCPHTPDAGCDCRKPAPGLVRQMERDLGCSARGAPLIGDKSSDLALARRVGARPILVRTGYGAATLATLDDPAVTVHADLAAAAQALTGAAAHKPPEFLARTSPETPGQPADTARGHPGADASSETPGRTPPGAAAQALTGAGVS